MTFQQGGKNSGNERLLRAIEADRAKSANAYTFNGVGLPTVGIPITKREDRVLIEIGGSYLRPYYKEPAVYHKMDGNHLVRRMSLVTLDTKIPSFGKSVDDGTCYVMVKTTIKNVVRHLINFHTDVEVFGGAKVILRDWVAKVWLVEMPKGCHINVFYEDGSVRRLEATDDGLAEVRLPLQVQAKYRVQLAVGNLNKLYVATNAADDQNIKARDRWYHQLADTLKIGARFIEDERDQIHQVFLQAAISGDLRRRTYDHVMEALGPARFATELMVAYTVGDAIDEVHGVERHRGPKQDRLKKLAERSARDKEFRDDTKGPILQDDSKKSKKGSKKK